MVTSYALLWEPPIPGARLHSRQEAAGGAGAPYVSTLVEYVRKLTGITHYFKHTLLSLTCKALHYIH